MQNVDTSKTAFCKKQRRKSNHIFSKITFYQRYVTIIWIEMIHKTDDSFFNKKKYCGIYYQNVNIT